MKRQFGRTRAAARAFAAGVARAAKGIKAEVGLREACVVTGLAAAGYGIGQIHPPTAWIVIGTVVFLCGMRR